MPRTPKPNIRRRGDSFVVDFQVGGERIRKTIDAETETEARMIAHRLFVESLDHRQMQPMSAVRMTIAEAIDLFVKERRFDGPARSMMKTLRQMFGAIDTRMFDRTHLDRYRHERAKVLKASSMRTELGRISGFLNWLVDSNLLEKAPRVVWPRCDARSPNTLTRDEVGELLETIKGHRTFEPFYLLALCGLRRLEILNLKWSDVNTTDMTAIIRKSKTAVGVASIPLFGPIVEWVHANKSDSGFLVEMNTKTRGGDRLYHLVADWNRKHDRKLPNPHRCRHTIASELLQHGAPLVAVQKLLRHSSPAITVRVYGHVDALSFRQAINESLPAVLRGSGTKDAGGKPVGEEGQSKRLNDVPPPG